MPKGVEVDVEGGFATVDFVDQSLAGPGLSALLRVGGPESVETLTREGPRRKYRVPEGNAREAGLLDVPSGQTSVSPPSAHTQPRKGHGEGDPSMDWKLDDLRAYARARGLTIGHARTKVDMLRLIGTLEES